MSNKEFLADKNVFKKTLQEKVKTANIKKNWEKNMKMYYGEKWKKHNNYPFTLTDI